MSTQQLSDVVRSIVDSWVQEGRLFTALDVSIEVKQTLPHARHREVRDVVRAEYANMQNASYGRTDIDVQLEDGSTVKAMLYHPLSDSWDLDAKYDAQQRAQTLKSKPVVTAPALPQAVAAPPGVSPTSVFGWCGTPPPNAPAPAPVNPNKHLWDSLFDSAPSLFPKR